MEIEINENEKYIITIPEKCNIETFQGMMIRLINIQKLISKEMKWEVPNSNTNVIEKEYQATQKKHRTFNLDRTLAIRGLLADKDKSIEMLKSYYSNKKIFNEFCEQFDITRNDTYSLVARIKQSNLVQPKDIGIKEWPKMGRWIKIPQNGTIN